MRLLAALVLASTALTTVGVAAAAHETQRVPSVKLVRMAPLVVSGTGFGGHASVRVTVSWKTTRLVKTVEATTKGTITASFDRSLTAYACRATRIEAVAGNGRHAAWQPGSKSCYAIAVPITPSG